MIRSLVGACVLAACGQGLPAKATEPAALAPGLGVSYASFDVVPAELADAHVLDRIHHRALIKRWGLAWLVRDGAPIGEDRSGAASERDLLPVIADQGRKIRIVVDDDAARYAVWIAREDTWDTALAPLALGDAGGTALPLWIEPGAALEIKERRGKLRHVVLVDDMLATEGWAAAPTIGNVWVAGPAKSEQRNTRAGLVRIGRGAELHAAAAASAPVLATIKADELVVARITVTGAFTEVEATRPFVRVRGFIETAKILADTDDFVTLGTGSGHGFGMSHAAKHEVPAGTCLYDHSDGQVIGVTLETQTRLGARLGEDGWAMVYIDTPWRVASMYVKNVGTDPAQPPSWDSCTEPSHRR